jgi:uncharacterized membrane protein YraQ (UPF0718 family)
VVPLFAGIYKKGAGLGPAITFLFVAPAVNILALSYTGTVIGLDLAVARLILAVVFGIGVGVIMALLFRKDDADHDHASSRLFAGQAAMRKPALVFLLVLVFLLITGTFKIGFLTESYLQLDLQWPGVNNLQSRLYELVPFDPAAGEEGVTAQGSLLIGLLILIGLASWRGLERIHEGFNTWTWISTGLVGLTLVLAAIGVDPYPGGVRMLFTGRFFAVLLSVAVLGWMLAVRLEESEQRDFLWETWRFVKQIFPLLVVGVFAVGMIRELIRPEWIQAAAGENTLLGNFVGVVFGVFMYFPTLVEVPIAEMFLRLGMHRGPLLAYLISDPELSLQSILITASLIGRGKAWVYVLLVSLFSTAAGLLYGAWVDGTSLLVVGLWLAAIIAVLAVAVRLLSRHGERVVEQAAD